MNLFDKTVDTIGWIKIFLAPFFLGLFIGGCMFIFSDNIWVKLGGLFVFILGIFAGVGLANYTKESVGTQEAIQQLNATPDWDNLTKDMRDKEDHERYNGGHSSEK